MNTSPEVILEQGKLRGSVGADFFGKPYYSFQGIPYAKPPIGELRFKAPVPAEKWNGTFDATKEGSASISIDIFDNNKVIGGEDCLVLNVYTKSRPSEGQRKLLPVLFWIHGGGFLWGSSRTKEYSPDFLITEDVVIVSINYRLGLLGFLRLKDASLGVPGNAGLKDMVLALKWVQKNIDKFGGDPGNVTIFGESAGGAAVHFLILSPLARGLFHKAIAQSGSVFNPWARGNQNISEHIAKIVGLKDGDEKALLNYLLKQPVEKIYEIQEKFPEKYFASFLRPFSPVVEEGSNEPAFLPEEPMKIIASGNYNHLPFIVGYCSAEAICFDSMKGAMGLDFETLFEANVPWTLGYKLGSDESRAIAEKIKNFYYGDEEPSTMNSSKRILLDTDTAFVEGIYHTVEKHILTSKSPIYLYRLSLETSLNFLKRWANIETPGVSHADDIGYLFKNFTTPEIKEGSPEDIGWRRFVKLWTNFAKYGNPTPNKNDPLINIEWKPVETSNINILDIDEKLSLLSNPESDRMLFWRSLFVESPSKIH